MTADRWLERWLALLQWHGRGSRVLELGCGIGSDAWRLSEAGHDVIALDACPATVARARERAPNVRFVCQDMRAPFPVDARSVAVVVASLSLHFFPWAETLSLIARIRECLIESGIVLCRVNSVADVHYGAVGHPRIAEDFYMVDGQPKRFFNRETALRLFSCGWSVLSAEEFTIEREGRAPKVLWEMVARKSAIVWPNGAAG
jgi:SAM-dependent methyltransferase